MGLVYRAWNLRLKRVEAVKVIAEEFARDGSFHDRFERETEIAAAIDHPNVVTVYDCGDGPGGELFIAMRYVEGTTLERLIAERRQLDPQLACALIAQVASALDAAHALGLVHRDVKPANILLAGAENDYRAYLTDFGLAKRLSSETVLTSAGLMVGTLDYMAPEQAQGRPVDQRSDVYALGATLYRALTGQVPFPGDQEVTKLLAKVRDLPPAPSRIAPDLPRALDAVLGRALSLDPADRYPSAGELARSALAAASAGPRSAVSATAPQPRQLSQPVLAICENALATVGEPPARAALQDVRRELVTPVRLGLVGGSAEDRASLCSALLGRPLDPAAHEELSLTPALSLVPADRAEGFLVVVSTPGYPEADAVRRSVLDALDGHLASAVNCICALSAAEPGPDRDAAPRAKQAIGWRVAAVVSVDLSGPGRGEPDEVAGGGQDGVTGGQPEGVQELWQQIHGLVERVDALRAQTGLAALEELSFRDRSLSFLRDRVESVRFEPRMHVLDLVAALQRCQADDIDLPQDLQRALERLVTGRSLGQRLGAPNGQGGPELTQQALAQYRDWKGFENGSHASPRARRVAETVARSLQLLAREAEEPG
jgi:hypothetical protein